MEKDKLLKLADFLDTVPTELFNLQWVQDNWPRANDKEDFLKKWYDKDVECGATACAIGWLPVVLPEDAYYEEKCSNAVRLHNFYSESMSYDDKAMAVFDITRAEADYLFNPGCYDDKDMRNPKVVANRIRRVVESQ